MLLAQPSLNFRKFWFLLVINDKTSGSSLDKQEQILVELTLYSRQEKKLYQRHLQAYLFNIFVCSLGVDLAPDVAHGLLRDDRLLVLDEEGEL